MKFKATALALAIAGVAAAGSAQASFLSESASAFSYDSVGVYYTDIEQGDYERDGFGFEGSLSVAPSLFVTGGVELTDDDDGDIWATRIGAGYHRDLGLSIPTDVVVQAGVTAYLDDPSDSAEDKEREFLWDSSIGLRSNLGIQGLDASAYIGVVEDITDDYDFTFAWGVSADYFLTPEFSLGLAYDVKDYEAEEEEALSFGVKYHF